MGTESCRVHVKVRQGDARYRGINSGRRKLHESRKEVRAGPDREGMAAAVAQPPASPTRRISEERKSNNEFILIAVSHRANTRASQSKHTVTGISERETWIPRDILIPVGCMGTEPENKQVGYHRNDTIETPPKHHLEPNSMHKHDDFCRRSKHSRMKQRCCEKGCEIT